jgi:hypothetical protein
MAFLLSFGGEMTVRDRGATFFTTSFVLVYGVEGQGWFLGVHCFTKYVKVAFFRSTSLRPVPPGEPKSNDTRYLDIHESDKIDEAWLAAWMQQASQLPGERT